MDVHEGRPPRFAGRPLSDAGLPADSRVVAVVRDGEWIRPTGREVVRPGDWVIVMASPAAARAWGRLVSGRTRSGRSRCSAPAGGGRPSPGYCWTRGSPYG
ncbi:TrkA C-terminal domain-containing protein [Tsukamurella paurometabola]